MCNTELHWSSTVKLCKSVYIKYAYTQRALITSKGKVTKPAPECKNSVAPYGQILTTVFTNHIPGRHRVLGSPLRPSSCVDFACYISAFVSTLNSRHNPKTRTLVENCTLSTGVIEDGSLFLRELWPIISKFYVMGKDKQREPRWLLTSVAVSPPHVVERYDSVTHGCPNWGALIQCIQTCKSHGTFQVFHYMKWKNIYLKNYCFVF